MIITSIFTRFAVTNFHNCLLTIQALFFLGKIIFLPNSRENVDSEDSKKFTVRISKAADNKL